MSGDKSVVMETSGEESLMAFGKNKSDNDASNLWTLEAGFRNLWTIESVSDREYVLTGRSAESHGWLNMRLVIDRRSGNHTCTAQWGSPEMRRNEAKPKPVKLNVTLTLKKGRNKKAIKV